MALQIRGSSQIIDASINLGKLDANGGTIAGDLTLSGGLVGISNKFTVQSDALIVDSAGDVSMSGTLSSSLTVGSGKTLDVSGGTLTLADDQISGDKIDGGDISGDLTLSGGLIGISNKLTVQTDALIVDSAGDVSMSGDLVITGDLTVNGTTTTLNTATLDVEDLNITVASGASTSAAADGGGLTIAGAGATFNWVDAQSRMELNKPLYVNGSIAGASLSVSGNVTASGNIAGSAISGDSLSVSGNISSSSGNLSGVNVSASGDVAFGTLTDSGESISITKFVDEADGISNNDNDTSIPTSAAVKYYVDNQLTNALDLSGESIGELLDVDVNGTTAAKDFFMHDGSKYVNVYEVRDSIVLDGNAGSGADDRITITSTTLDFESLAMVFLNGQKLRYSSDSTLTSPDQDYYFVDGTTIEFANNTITSGDVVEVLHYVKRS